MAAFARVVLELMALGAPADLVAAHLAAAADEVTHAELAFGLASASLGRPVSAGPLPAAPPRALTLAGFAVATAREGGIAETISALRMAEARDEEAAPHVRAVLARIADDEARHAALAWRTLAWAVSIGGAPVREALAEVFATPARDRAWERVIAPAVRAVLGSPPLAHCRKFPPSTAAPPPA